jgi:hypothetical protein
MHPPNKPGEIRFDILPRYLVFYQSPFLPRL